MCTLIAGNECISAFYFQFESQVILILLQSHEAPTQFIPNLCEQIPSI